MQMNERITFSTFVIYINSLYMVQRIKDKYFSMINSNLVLSSLFLANHAMGNNSLDFEKSYESSFFIKNIESYNKRSRREFLSSVISDQRNEVYDAQTMFPSNINIYEFDEQKYVGIISLSTLFLREIDKNQFFQSFGLKLYNPYIGMGRAKQTQDYYREMFGDYPESISKGIEIFEENMVSESIEIDSDIADILNGCKIKELNNIKGILLSIWDVILAKSFNKSTIISTEAAMFSKPLPVSFIRHNVNKNFDEIVLDTVKALNSYDEHSDCRIIDMEAALERPISDVVSCLSDFSMFYHDVEASELGVGAVIELPSLADVSAALRIYYRYLDGKYVIEYHYEKKIFSDISIRELHDNVMAILRQILSAATHTQNVAMTIDGVKPAKDANEKRLLDMKLHVINKCEIFKECTSSEKEYIAENSNIVPYNIGAGIVSPNRKYDVIRLVTNGKVTEEGISKEGYVEPLMLIKEGEFFGFEALFEPYVSKDIYSASTKMAFIMEIQVSAIKTIYAVHPDVVVSFMKIVAERGEKFKKLWMMN